MTRSLVRDDRVCAVSADEQCSSLRIGRGRVARPRAAEGVGPYDGGRGCFPLWGKWRAAPIGVRRGATRKRTRCGGPTCPYRPFGAPPPEGEAGGRPSSGPSGHLPRRGKAGRATIKVAPTGDRRSSLCFVGFPLRGQAAAQARPPRPPAGASSQNRTRFAGLRFCLKGKSRENSAASPSFFLFPTEPASLGFGGGPF